ncbi:MAG TPA: AAA family ATPase, partial [Burkholderiaceae bacterium]|nr:AAA family ATPase [Burkholderiaceae bacterium]
MADDSSADPTWVTREYELLRSLGGVGFVRPVALIAEGGKLAMQLDATPGVSLAALLTQQPPDLTRALGIMIGLTHAVGLLHAEQVVHGDLRPANVLVDSTGPTVQIADLSVAARRSAAAGAAALAPADWAYVSPEQTGRMNRDADHRADFYALGVVLYLMLTGRLPFQANDAMEWVHCHVARMPQPPAELSPSVPLAVSDIAMKLLAKTAEQRYQSAHGLQADLKRVLGEWQTSGHVAEFALGTEDTLERLQIAKKLYGREAETQALKDAFTRVTERGHPELLLVAGYSGIGKTSLVHELHKPLAAANGYFVAGKFDRLQRAVPYSALSQALGQLLRQILSESEERVAAWRSQVNDALGDNGQLMVDMIPALQLLVGTQPPAAELGPTETQNRLGIVFRRFISVFTRRKHPLVLFLDDLQWADPASLALVRELVTHPEIHALLLVGAYRDNEVNDAHPLMLMLERTRKERPQADAMRRPPPEGDEETWGGPAFPHQRPQADALRRPPPEGDEETWGGPAFPHDSARIVRIVLRPLAAADVARLLSDTMRCTVAEAQPLADLIHDKTGGNPFFVIQFLTELHFEGLIVFDSRCRRWCWDIDSLLAKNHTDNVVELMLAKLRRLPASVQEVLQRAACLGTAGETRMLVTVLDRPEHEVLAALAEAARASLVVHLDGSFRFVHDRVQEAAYALIPEAVRATTHLQIGRWLLQRLSPEQIEQRVFEVVNQLNRGAALVANGPEAGRLAQMNLVAGKRAKRATAFTSAREYFVRALDLWPDSGWHTRYAQTLHLHLDLAECEYLMNNFERAEEWLRLVLAHATSDEDRTRAHGVRIMLHMAGGRFGKAVDAALAGLRLHGLVIPDTDKQLQAMIDAEQR